MVKKIIVISGKWDLKTKVNRLEVDGVFNTRADFVKYLSEIKHNDFFKIIDMFFCGLDDIGVRSEQIGLSSHPDLVIGALEEAGREDIIKAVKVANKNKTEE